MELHLEVGEVENPYIDGPHTRNIEETLDIVEYDEIVKIELHTYYSICKDSNNSLKFLPCDG